MRGLVTLGRIAGTIAVAASVAGCPFPCETFVDPNPLMEKHFEDDPECAADPLCGMQIVNGSARRTQTFQAGEHGLEIASGSEVAQSMSLALPDSNTRDASLSFRGPRQEYVRMIVRCDEGATMRVEELVSETLRGTPAPAPDSGIIRRDAGRDAGPADVVVAQDVSEVDASADVTIADGSDPDAGDPDATASDAGDPDASIEDASTPEDTAIADASFDDGFDSGTMPAADSGIPASDAGFSTPPPPRLRIGTATIATSTRWARITATFVTQSLAPAIVESANVLNVRIIVSGRGVCTIDDFQYGSIDAGTCPL